jgi:hypothetical protein
MAEGQGFEPWVPLDTPVFKTGAFDHSATPPKRGGIIPKPVYRSMQILFITPLLEEIGKIALTLTLSQRERGIQ